MFVGNRILDGVMQFSFGARACCGDAPRPHTKAVFGTKDTFGGRIWVYHQVFACDDDYAVPDNLQGACQLNGAVGKCREFVLRA